MAAAFVGALQCLRAASTDLLRPTRIDQLASGHRLFRNRQLTPGVTLRLYAQQIAHGNLACSAVHHLAGEDFSDSAWCQARARLPIETIERVNRCCVEAGLRELDRESVAPDELASDDVAAPRWRGHRTFIVDGTSDSMPDAPELRGHYGVPGNVRDGLGFPTSHLLMLMEHRAGLIVGCIDSPMRTHDASIASQVHHHLSSGDVILGDVAFAGYAHLALILRANLHAVMPSHQKRIVDFTPGRAHAHPRKGKSTKRAGKPRSRLVKRLGHDDQLVEYFKPVNRPEWMSVEAWDALPGSITVREVRRTVKCRGFRPIAVTVVTTLLDPVAYPAEDIVELRLTRWMIETNFRHLKITLGMDVLKCKTLDGVRKERLMFILVYNMLRVLMLKAARAQHVHANRISFADALAWLRHAAPRGELPLLKVNPRRAGRLEPRKKKRQKKQFPYMKSPRSVLKAQLRANQCDTT